MKTMLVVFLLTIVFVISMVFIENKRQEGLNKINLEYKQGLAAIGIYDNSSSSDDSSTSSSTSDDEDEDQITCTIEGAIVSAGEYEIDKGATLNALITQAGGLNTDADTKAFNLYYIINEGETFYIPTTEQTNKVSINTATITELDSLPGIGETIATRIVNYREEYGNFATIDHLKKVTGVGSSLFKKIREYIIL